MKSSYGLPIPPGTKMINKSDLGNLVYLKVLLQFKEPELFICRFSSSEDLYIGKMVEQFPQPSQPTTIITNYYFVGANPSEIKQAEKDFSFMRKLFKHRPVLHLNMASGMGDPVLRWKTETGMNPMYETPEDEDYG